MISCLPPVVSITTKLPSATEPSSFLGAGGYCTANQLFGELGGISDGGRRQDENRIGSVEATYPSQPTNDIRHMRTENTAVGGQFVDDHKAAMNVSTLRGRARAASVGCSARLRMAVLKWFLFVRI